MVAWATFKVYFTHWMIQSLRVIRRITGYPAVTCKTSVLKVKECNKFISLPNNVFCHKCSSALCTLSTFLF